MLCFLIHRCRLIALIVLATGQFPLAEVAIGDTLRDALIATYLNNPTLQAARAELRVVNERVPQELANWRPQVIVRAGVGRQNREERNRFATETSTTTPLTGSVTASQPIYRGGRTIAGVDRAEKEVLAQRAFLEATEQDILQRAVEAYMNVWRDQTILNLTQQNVDLVRESLIATEARFGRGIVTRTDVAQAESRLSGAIADREAAEGNLESSLAVYDEVVGHSPINSLERPAMPAGLPATLESATTMAQSQNPAIAAANFSEQAARHEIRQVLGELMPSLTLDGTLSHQEKTTDERSAINLAQIMLNLTVPLYQRGQVSSRVREANQRAGQRRSQVLEEMRRVKRQTLSGWAELQSTRRQIELIDQQVKSARVALKGVQEEHQVGARTVLDVLDAKQELINGEIALVRAMRDVTVAAFRVLTAIGQLTARALELDVNYIDPVAPYEKVRDLWFGLDAPQADSR